ncbi:MAG: N-acetylglucosamine-6-phosphate deacetylase [Clostridiales bacterium]|nr:N-acetylglucosamine-6-phosphate deacetylase [Clostridiales bacterium]
MRLVHADIFDEQFEKRCDQTVILDGERIASIAPFSENAEEKTTDLSGLTLYPGFIDMHIHGAKNADTSDADVVGLRTISRFLCEKGVTSFCPTTMMIPEEQLSRVLSAADAFSKEEPQGARMIGVRLEGPFLSKEKCGVQNSEYSQSPSKDYIDLVRKDLRKDVISVIDLAPELSGSLEFIKGAEEDYVLSVAHTAATFDCCSKAIEEGARHATHLFNAMNPLHHHEPGAVGAFLDAKDTTCEMICDGMHVHPAVLRFAIQILGENRLVVVSDAMRAAGMPDGDYDLGGKTVHVKGGRTDFGDGRLAGSTTNLHDEFLKLLSFGIPFKTALKACTINPAKVLRIDEETGSLSEGKYADMVAMDQDYRVRMVWVRGKLVFDDREGAFS